MPLNKETKQLLYLKDLFFLDLIDSDWNKKNVLQIAKMYLHNFTLIHNFKPFDGWLVGWFVGFMAYQPL